jgi:hypothetical protein
MRLSHAGRHPDPCATSVPPPAVPTNRSLCTLASAPARLRIWTQVPNTAVSATTTFGGRTRLRVGAHSRDSVMGGFPLGKRRRADLIAARARSPWRPLRSQTFPRDS